MHTKPKKSRSLLQESVFDSVLLSLWSLVANQSAFLHFKKVQKNQSFILILNTPQPKSCYLLSVSWCAVVVAANRELRNGHKNAFDALHVYVKWLVGENANSPNNILTFVAVRLSAQKGFWKFLKPYRTTIIENQKNLIYQPGNF